MHQPKDKNQINVLQNHDAKQKSDFAFHGAFNLCEWKVYSVYFVCTCLYGHANMYATCFYLCQDGCTEKSDIKSDPQKERKHVEN